MSQRTSDTNSDGQAPQIVDFNKARENKMEKKRRYTERIFFKNLLSVYAVIGQSKLHPIELMDISEDGCSFQIPYTRETPLLQDANPLPLRLYFSQDTYIEIIIHIQHSRPAIENHTRYTRYGCSVDKHVQSYPAFQKFVSFLKAYSEHAHKDLGDVTVFYL